MEATTKYEMRSVWKMALRLLVQSRFLEAEPLRAFIVANRYKSETEARLAAKCVLRHPLFGRDCLAELVLIDAAVLFRVL